MSGAAWPCAFCNATDGSRSAPESAGQFRECRLYKERASPFAGSALMKFGKIPVRRRILVLLALGSLLAGLDRAGLEPAIESVRAALRVPSPALDISFGAYGFGFFLALALGGFLTERLGPPRVLFGCGILAALAMCATAATVHVVQLAL